MYDRSINNNSAGPNYYAGIRAELPLFNNLARGEMLYRKSTAKQAQLKAELLSNHIGSEVFIAIERLHTALNEYRLARQSEEEYRKAADHEHYKVKEGTSGISDLINMEDRYYNARANRLNATRKHASALAELRFVTGTLLTEDDEEMRAKIQDLMEPLILTPPTE